MASIANTAFETSVSNISRNNTQNVAGTYLVDNAGTLVPDICPSGFLVVQDALMANDGYQGLGTGGTDILNGNTWDFVQAEDGTGGWGGDSTGIFAFNSYYIRQGEVGGNIYNVGTNYLGLELPAGEVGDFTEIKIGEQYTFGAGNFSTAPSGPTTIYCTIADGLLVASATAPVAGTGLYFLLMREKSFTVGARNAGFKGYVLQARRA